MAVSSFNYTHPTYSSWNYDNIIVVEGVQVAVANIGRLRRNLREANKKFVLKKAAELWYRTTGIVPYSSGALYRSAFIRSVSSTPSNPVQAVGYDPGIAPHGVFVHEWTGREHPTRGPRSEPKQDHFLSEPRDQMAATFKSDLERELAATISRMRSPIRGV